MTSFVIQTKEAIQAAIKKMNDSFTEIIGDELPFSYPVMNTDELKHQAFVSTVEGDTKEKEVPETHFTATVGPSLPFIKPNAESEEELLKAINTETDLATGQTTLATFATSVMGRYVVPNGQYGFLQTGHRVRLLFPGRYLFPHWRDKTSPLYDASRPVIQNAMVTIVRVTNGEYGLAEHNGQPVILLRGRHAFNGNFRFLRMVKQSDREIVFVEHQNAAKILTIQSGNVGVVSLRGALHVYPAGRYAFNEPTTMFLRMIDLQTGHEMSLSDDNANLFAAKAQKPLENRPDVQCGPVSFVRIQVDELGLAQDNGRLVVLMPGLHLHNDSSWTFLRRFKINAKPPPKNANKRKERVGGHSEKKDELDVVEDDAIICGPLKIFSVRPGFVRALRKNNANDPSLMEVKETNSVSVTGRNDHELDIHRPSLTIVGPGRYAVNHPNVELADEVDLQVLTVEFVGQRVMLSGGVNMAITGLLRYQVTNPRLLVTNMGFKNLMEFMEDTSTAEVSQVFASVSFESVSAFAQQNAATDEKAITGPNAMRSSEGGGVSRSAICEHVIEAVQKDSERFGVTVLNFQMEDLQLADKNAQEAFSRNNIQLAQATSEQKITQVTALTATKQAEQEQQRDLVKVQTKTKTQLLEIEAKNKAEIQAMEAKVKSETIKVDGEARNKLAKAKADAEALVIAADAARTAAIKEAEGRSEAIRLEGKAKNEAQLGMGEGARQLALAQLQVDAVRACSSKIEKLTVTDKNLMIQNMFAPLFRNNLGVLPAGMGFGGMGFGAGMGLGPLPTEDEPTHAALPTVQVSQV